MNTMPAPRLPVRFEDVIKTVVFKASWTREVTTVIVGRIVLVAIPDRGIVSQRVLNTKEFQLRQE